MIFIRPTNDNCRFLFVYIWDIQLLQEKMPYRQISERTGVSVTTIGRVARYWREGAGGYQLALERINK